MCLFNLHSPEAKYKHILDQRCGVVQGTVWCSKTMELGGTSVAQTVMNEIQKILHIS